MYNRKKNNACIYTATELNHLSDLTPRTMTLLKLQIYRVCRNTKWSTAADHRDTILRSNS